MRVRPTARQGDCELRLPVSVNALIVTGDAAARASMPRLALQPVSIVARGRRPPVPRAAKAARYGDLVVYSFTPEVYLEGPGLWIVAGSRCRWRSRWIPRPPRRASCCGTVPCRTA